MSDARIADGAEGGQERPRGGAALKAKVEALRQAERQKAVQREAEERRGDERALSELQAARWAVSHLNRKLLGVAEDLKARFEADDVAGLMQEFEQNGHQSIVLGEGLSDEFIHETLNLGQAEPKKVAEADPQNVGQAESAVMGRYRELASGKAPLRMRSKSYMFEGSRKKDEAAAKQANQAELANYKDLADRNVPWYINSVKKTLGFKQLNAALAEAGFQLEVVAEGPIMKFVAVPIPEGAEKPAASVENDLGVAPEIAAKLRAQGAESALAEKNREADAEKAAATLREKDAKIAALEAAATADRKVHDRESDLILKLAIAMAARNGDGSPEVVAMKEIAEALRARPAGFEGNN